MNNQKIGCYILSYGITKGMKSIGPKGLLKSKKNKELINCQIDSIRDVNTDINIIVGFGSDKLKKKINICKQIHIIHNDLYETTNQGYALELILKDYMQKQYSGCIIINDGILISSAVKNILLDNLDLQCPKIIYLCSEVQKDIFNIGFSLSDSNYVQHMFFDLTNNLWTETVYLDHQSLTQLYSIYNPNMRNMFLFEIINKSIDVGINYKPIRIKNSQILKINGVKDSKRIKENI